MSNRTPFSTTHPTVAHSTALASALLSFIPPHSLRYPLPPSLSPLPPYTHAPTAILHCPHTRAPAGGRPTATHSRDHLFPRPAPPVGAPRETMTTCAGSGCGPDVDARVRTVRPPAEDQPPGCPDPASEIFKQSAEEIPADLKYPFITPRRPHNKLNKMQR